MQRQNLLRVFFFLLKKILILIFFMESLNCVEESPTASVACIYYTHMPVQFYDNFHERLSITAYATQ